jgi:DNA-binding response OmpR family regulator
MSILNSTIDDPYDVLVVDDQPMIIEAVRRLLRSDSNARVHGCGFALEALARAKDLLPAVILQDLTMTDGNGLDLVTAYRAEPLLAETSVVVLSGIEDPQVKAEAFSRGAADYIEKLPPPVEFVARVKHHARAARAQKQMIQAAVAAARAEEQAEWAETPQKPQDMFSVLLAFRRFFFVRGRKHTCCPTTSTSRSKSCFALPHFFTMSARLVSPTLFCKSRGS